MAQSDDDARDPIMNEPVLHIQKQLRNKYFVISSLFLFLILFFCLICMGFWYVNQHSNGRSFNIYIITSGNDHIKARIVSGPDDYGTPTQIGKSDTVDRPSTLTTPSGTLCSTVPDLEKFDCFPNEDASEENCISIGCCYQEVRKRGSGYVAEDYSLPPLGTPNCFFPADYVGYRIEHKTVRNDYHIKAKLVRIIPSSFPSDISELDLDVNGIDENSLRIKITDSKNARHEAPLNTPVDLKDVKQEDKLYEIKLYTNGTLAIRRKSTKQIIFVTNLSQLVYADQFLQISTELPTKYIYGLGEHYDHLLKDVNWTRTPLFNRDNHPQPKVILYGTHPFYVALESDFNCHGVFLLNSNSMDVILQPTPALTFRTIGGILDLFVFLGPTPSKVVQQYTNIVSKPFMPPYWSLGFHLCRYEYNSLNETKKVWNRTRNAGIPFDTQWNDIDYMQDHNDFTYDIDNFKELPEFVGELHNSGMHYVLIIDPGISNTEKLGSYSPFDDGINMDIFIKNSTGDIFIGKVWNPNTTVFPDFSHPKATDYWIKQFKGFHEVIPFDGAWIDMNEPANFYDGQINGCGDNPLDNPPYVPGGLEPLRTHTLCMSAKHYKTTHYNEHSLYAYREAIATYRALTSISPNERPFIISRSSFSGQGRWSGHWSGDIESSWEDLRYSVYDLLKFNLYGMPMMGSDICGFTNDTTVELCARWTTLGSFYPFSRNHNDKGQKDQDPVAMGDIVVEAAKNTLTTRYKLLPYLYYLFYKSHIDGYTVVRPLFFEFVNDPNTYSIDEQFMWGPALMIMPALYPNITHIEAYFPDDIWYDFYTGQNLNVSGQKTVLKAPLESINLALRGGYIIPQQHSNTTTTESRKNKFFLLAGLSKNNDAVGELYWDDGISIDSYKSSQYNYIKFDIKQGTLTSVVSKSGYKTKMVLDFVRICGLKGVPSEVTLNGSKVPFEFQMYNCLQVTVNTNVLKDFIMRWT